MLFQRQNNPGIYTQPPSRLKRLILAALFTVIIIVAVILLWPRNDKTPGNTGAKNQVASQPTTPLSKAAATQNTETTGNLRVAYPAAWTHVSVPEPGYTRLDAPNDLRVTVQTGLEQLDQEETLEVFGEPIQLLGATYRFAAAYGYDEETEETTFEGVFLVTPDGGSWQLPYGQLADGTPAYVQIGIPAVLNDDGSNTYGTLEDLQGDPYYAQAISILKSITPSS